MKFFESLESRQLMSVSVNVSNGVLRIDGDALNNNVLVDQDGTTVYVFDDNILSRLIPVQQVQKIEFNGLAGNDKFEATRFVTKPVNVQAGTGNDTITTGSGDDTVVGDIGNDSIVGGAGHDRLEGQGGNDSIRGELGNDTIGGGTGNDQIFGGAENDLCIGEIGNDTIFGDGGSDTLFGGDNDDFIVGGAGRDSMFGQGGNDTIRAARDFASDFVDGGTGFDVAQVDRFLFRDRTTGIEFFA